jgi:hypothetical protein
MRPKRQLSDRELQEHLDEQLAFLEVSSDAGFEGEAKRLAVTLRVLLHNSQTSKSLVGMLGNIDGQFFDTALPVNSQSVLSHGGLVWVASGSSKTRYVAMLDNVPVSRWVSFAEWWDVPVFIDTKKRELSRRQLVLTAANQDGGAHVDPALDAVYADLSKENSLGWIATDKKHEGFFLGRIPTDKQGDRLIAGPEKAAIRQIVHEALKSLKPGYAKMPQHDAEMIIGGPVLVTQRPTRNGPCPCGSGRKFKHCHGMVK